MCALIPRAVVCLWFVTICASCSRSAAPAPAPAKLVVDAGSPRPAEEPAAAPAAPTEPPREAARGVHLRRVKPQKHGCVARFRQALPGVHSRALALYMAAEPAVLAVAQDGRELSLFRVNARGEFERTSQRSLGSPVKRLSAVCSARCALGLVDERAQLVALELDGARFSEPRVLAKGVDRRFAPALALHDERTFIAYTSSVEDAMHTHLIVLAGGKASAARDLTPAGHGAAAPTFVLGSALPTLLFIDARAGFSPLLEVPFAAGGAAGEPIVRTPVSQPYAPPLLAAVQWASGEVEVFFTAVGKAAMTAVGRVWLRRASEPSALLPSKGYGDRELSVAHAGELALFAIETEGERAQARTIALKLSDGSRTYDVPWFGEPSAARPSLASGHERGEFLAAYSRGSELSVALLSCAN